MAQTNLTTSGVEKCLPAKDEPLRLLAVHAHPDDESSKGAASTAKYISEGVQIMVVSCTGGERGDILNPGFELGDRSIYEVRKDEMKRAAEILGVSHRWLGFEDSGWPDGDPKPPLPKGCFADLPLETVSAPLVEIVREFKPHVITTYDENGGYPHPDHIRTHEVSMFAWEQAANPNYKTDQEPWAAAKLYYHHGFSKLRVQTMHEACQDLGIDSPYQEWLDEWEDEDLVTDRVTARIDCANWFPIREAALKAHETQIDPNGSWFAIPNEKLIEIWPTEDYELAISRIGEIVEETDLFEGLRGA
jgi:mycothiol S-conjugate amidase